MEMCGHTPISLQFDAIRCLIFEAEGSIGLSIRQSEAIVIDLHLDRGQMYLQHTGTPETLSLFYSYRLCIPPMPR